MSNTFFLCSKLDTDRHCLTITKDSESFLTIRENSRHILEVHLARPDKITIRTKQGFQSFTSLFVQGSNSESYKVINLHPGCSPIVDINVVLKASSENLNNRHVLPTPESPISSSLKSRS
jgi:hypothetical protein